MNNELEWVWKETVVEFAEKYWGKLWNVLARIFSMPAQIQIEYILNTRLECYYSANTYAALP
jgi:hypothetical protein